MIDIIHTQIQGVQRLFPIQKYILRFRGFSVYFRYRSTYLDPGGLACISDTEVHTYIQVVLACISDTEVHTYIQVVYPVFPIQKYIPISRGFSVYFRYRSTYLYPGGLACISDTEVHNQIQGFYSVFPIQKYILRSRWFTLYFRYRSTYLDPGGLACIFDTEVHTQIQGVQRVS